MIKCLPYMKTVAYDLTVHLLSENDAAVQSILSDAGATNVSRKEFVKVELVYPVKKNDACFMAIYLLELPTDKVKEVGDRLRREELCIRHLLVKQSGRVLPVRRPRETHEPRRSGDTALTNEALAEKIREIGETL